MNILVTGSAGYIGSAFCFDMLKIGFNVVGIDNYVNSDGSSTEIVKKNFRESYAFYNLDLADIGSDLNSIFIKHNPDLVVHFAALKSVAESERNPALYWKNNIDCTKNILQSMLKTNCKKIIFSSSAAVYGNQSSQPIKEDAFLRPTSVYAETKIECENLIKIASKEHKIDGISLRYFNPVGCHSSNLFKEILHRNDSSLMNEVIKAALDKNKILKIYGRDYSTKDGSCLRDFIHIDDVLNAHKKATTYISNFTGYDTFNIGTGRPISVIDLIHNFMKENKVSLNYEFTGRRIGDIESCYANACKAKNLLKWKSKKTLEDMVKDSWKTYKK